MMKNKLAALFFLSLLASSSYAVVLPVPAAPDVNAKSFLLIDQLTEKILAERNASDRVEPASLTKIMTVYVAAHELKDGNISLTEELLISEKAWKMEGSKMFLEVGDKVDLKSVLLGIIVQSGNDACVALAEHISGTEDVFAALMNLRSQELGMKDTNFVNATGLPDPEHYTTALDLAILTKALITEFPDIYDMFKIKEYTYGGIKQNNRNNLLWRDKTVDGVKTGHTESAGYCLVSSGARDGSRMISVVLGSASTESRLEASQSLLNYGFRFFEPHKLKEANKELATAKVWMGNAESVKLGIAKDLNVVIPRRQFEHLQATMDIDSRVIAPVTPGSQLGTLNVSLNDEEISSVPLIALEAVGEASFFKRLMDKARLYLADF